MSGSRDIHSTCTGCCYQDYCNRNCSALGHASATTQVPITDAPTVFQTTTNKPTPQLSFERMFCERANYTYDKKLGICYKLQSNVTLPWQQARDHCRLDGADLIVFHSLDEESFFEAMVQEDRQPDGIRYWVGATDVLTEMHFQWLDGVTVDPAFFHPNEPNNAFDGEDCLAATFFSNEDKRILLNDDSCDTPSNFICELDITALHNAHSSPLKQFCSTSGYTYSSQARSCYKIYKDHLTMTEARWRCQADMANLLILRDVHEEQYFQHQDFHDKDNDHRYWVGGTRTPDDTFQWLDGSPLNPSLQWFAGEPNNYQSNESCLSMTYFDGDRENFLLNDDNCAKNLYFICEELCPDGTYRYIPSLDMCFKIYNVSVTWSEARDRCKHDKATLAEVDTIAKLAYFQITLGEEAKKNGHKYWVGAHLSTNGEFHWLSTDHLVSKELWQSTEPSPGESCVALHRYPIQYGDAFKLNNRQCDLTDRFICQYIRGV